MIGTYIFHLMETKWAIYCFLCDIFIRYLAATFLDFSIFQIFVSKKKRKTRKLKIYLQANQLCQIILVYFCFMAALRKQHIMLITKTLSPISELKKNVSSKTIIYIVKVNANFCRFLEKSQNISRSSCLLLSNFVKQK